MDCMLPRDFKMAALNIVLLALFAIATAEVTPVPLVIWHGMGEIFITTFAFHQCIVTRSKSSNFNFLHFSLHARTDTVQYLQLNWG